MIGVVPSTLEWKKGSWSAHVKLRIGVALFEVTVTKIFNRHHWMFFLWNNKLLSVGQTRWCLAYRTTTWPLLVHSVLATNRLDTSGFFTISRNMYRCHLEVLIVSLRLANNAFPTGCLTVFSHSVDLKQAAT